MKSVEHLGWLCGDSCCCCLLGMKLAEAIGSQRLPLKSVFCKLVFGRRKPASTSVWTCSEVHVRILLFMAEGVWKLACMPASGHASRCGVDEFWAWVLWKRLGCGRQWGWRRMRICGLVDQEAEASRRGPFVVLAWLLTPSGAAMKSLAEWGHSLLFLCLENVRSPESVVWSVSLTIQRVAIYHWCRVISSITFLLSFTFYLLHFTFYILPFSLPKNIFYLSTFLPFLLFYWQPCALFTLLTSFKKLFCTKLYLFAPLCTFLHLFYFLTLLFSQPFC